VGLSWRALCAWDSTGVRRVELAALQLYDLDTERGTLTVRLGKGGKDRVVPVGERALHWIGRYLDEVRPSLVVPPDDGVRFLSDQGSSFALPYITNLMRHYIETAKIAKTGAVHIFRHTMATPMLEGGADVSLHPRDFGPCRLLADGHLHEGVDQTPERVPSRSRAGSRT